MELPRQPSTLEAGAVHAGALYGTALEILDAAVKLIADVQTLMAVSLAGLGASVDGAEGRSPDQALSRILVTKGFVTELMKLKTLQSAFSVGGMFFDPSWHMLLDLTRARLEEEQVSVSGLCVAAGIPITTASRRIDELAAAGFVSRSKDGSDGRRVVVTLTDEGYERMVRFLTALRVGVSLGRFGRFPQEE
jgi:predicted transcriptional regulator